MEDANFSCICDDDISSLDSHQHIPETADLRIRVKVFSKNGCLFFVDSYICKPWPGRLGARGRSQSGGLGQVHRIPAPPPVAFGPTTAA